MNLSYYTAGYVLGKHLEIDSMNFLLVI